MLDQPYGCGMGGCCICFSCGSETDCNDGNDNDCDGKVDCADSDCAGKSGPDGVTCCQKDADCAGVSCGGYTAYCVSGTCTCRYSYKSNSECVPNYCCSADSQIPLSDRESPSRCYGAGTIYKSKYLCDPPEWSGESLSSEKVKTPTFFDSILNFFRNLLG
jgi:hypothetical protein